MSLDYSTGEDEHDRALQSSGRIRGIRELSEAAKEYDFDPTIHLRYWIRTANTILRQAQIYDSESNFDEAYILYLRYAQLLLESLPNHPESRHASEKSRLGALRKSLPGVLDRLEVLKVAINEQYGRAKKRELQILLRRQELERARQRPEHQYLNKTQDQEDSNDISSGQAPNISFKPSDLRGLGAAEHEDLLRLQTSSYRPTFSTEASISLRNKDSDKLYNTSVPSHDKQEFTIIPVAQVQGVSTTSSIEHKAKATTEGGSSLRTIFLPSELRSSFLDIALPNTKRKLETCGILCGKLNRNAFFVTHLAIPEQESTTDTCVTKDEESLFSFLDENELFTLGWIHTHPTQTCFLSSIDLHTQNSYQLMLAESIAIVCAPMHDPSWGIFRLTDPPGLKIVTECRLPGTFHPHPEKNIYTSAMMPAGHVSVRDGLPFEIVDLRK
ncbi:hypothetical protein V1511DRAFT_494001 [Dipodascopsis uninucleata]